MEKASRNFLKRIQNKLLRPIFKNHYAGITIWLSFFLLILFAGIFIIANYSKLIEPRIAVSNLVLISHETDTIRYLLSSGFQGLSALFGLVISITFITTQWVSLKYSDRSIFWIVKKIWFRFGLALFALALFSNFVILSFLDNILAHQSLFVANNVITLASILYIVPYTYLFLESAHPFKYASEHIKGCDESFFKNISQNDDDKTSKVAVLLTTTSKFIEGSDFDAANRMIWSVCDVLKKHITPSNYEQVSSLFFPFFDRIINISQENQTPDIVRHTMHGIWKVHENLIPVDLIKAKGWLYSEQTLLDVLLKILEYSALNNQNALLNSVLHGVIGKLFKKYLDKMPTDAEIDEENEGRHQNMNFERHVELVFFQKIGEIALKAIHKQKRESATKILRFILLYKYDILKMDNLHKKISRQLMYQALFETNNAFAAAAQYRVNVFSETVHELEQIASADDADDDIQEYATELILNALAYSIEDDGFKASLEFSLSEVGALARGWIRKDTTHYAERLENIIDFYAKVLNKVLSEIDESLDPSLNRIKKKIYTELDSLLKFGLANNYPQLAYKVKLIQKENWPKKINRDYTHHMKIPQTKQTHTTVVAVVQHDDKILLLKRNQKRTSSPGKWQPVSGFIGEREPAEAAALREVKEETGLSGEIIKSGQVFEVTDDYGRWVIVPYLVRVTSDDVTIDPNEHDEYTWIVPADIDQFDTVAAAHQDLTALGLL